MRSTLATLTVAVLLTVSGIATAAPTKDFSSSGDSTSLVARNSLLSGNPVGLSDVTDKAKGLSVGSVLGGATKSSDGGSSSDGSGSSSSSDSGSSSSSDSGSSSSSDSGSSSSSGSGSSSSSDKIDPNKKCNSNSGPGKSDGDSCTEHRDDQERTN